MRVSECVCARPHSYLSDCWVSNRQREGIPERINRTALGAMMARGPLHDAIVLSRGVPLRPNPGGSAQRGLGRQTWGGRSTRGCGQGVSLSNDDAGYMRHQALIPDEFCSISGCSRRPNESEQKHVGVGYGAPKYDEWQ